MEDSVFTSQKPIILASGSPRRQDYFRDLGLDFTVHTSNIDESADPSELPDDFVNRIAYDKAHAVMCRFPRHWVVAADTIVRLDDMILGKPSNSQMAKKMLRSLSARVHTVQTGVCLCCCQENVKESFSVQTTVRFAELSDELIASYVATGEPLDKAGGYGIQGLGACLVTDISGSYTNVVGLPLTQTISLLLKNNVINPA